MKWGFEKVLRFSDRSLCCPLILPVSTAYTSSTDVTNLLISGAKAFE